MQTESNKNVDSTFKKFVESAGEKEFGFMNFYHYDPTTPVPDYLQYQGYLGLFLKKCIRECCSHKNTKEYKELRNCGKYIYHTPHTRCLDCGTDWY